MKVVARTGAAPSLLAITWLQLSSKASWLTRLPLIGSCHNLSASFSAFNKASVARTSIFVFLQSFHPRECRRSLWTLHSRSSRYRACSATGRLSSSRIVTRCCMSRSLWESFAVDLNGCWHSARSLSQILAFIGQVSLTLCFFRFVLYELLCHVIYIYIHKPICIIYRTDST